MKLKVAAALTSQPISTRKSSAAHTGYIITRERSFERDMAALHNLTAAELIDTDLCSLCDDGKTTAHTILDKGKAILEKLKQL